MKRICLPLLFATIALGQGAEIPLRDGAILKKIDALVNRYRHGDAGQRAVVVRETLLLGEAAVAELMSRAAAPRAFAGAAPGIAMAGPPAGRTNAAAALSIEIWEAKGNVPAAWQKVRMVPDKEFELAKKLGQFKATAVPKLTVLDGQRANITISSRKSYTRSFDVNGQPVGGAVSEGLMIEMRPRIRRDRSIDLELRYVASRLGEIDQLQTAAGRIGVPQLDMKEAGAELHLAPGKRIIVALPRAGHQGALLLLSIEAKVIPAAPRKK